MLKNPTFFIHYWHQIIGARQNKKGEQLCVVRIWLVFGSVNLRPAGGKARLRFGGWV
jgi:hypothetical protein